MHPILFLSISLSNWSIILAVVITTFNSNQLDKIYIQRKSSGTEDPFVNLNDEDKEKQCAEVLGSRYFRDILKRKYADKNEQKIREYVQMQSKDYVDLHYKVAKNSEKVPTYPYSSFSLRTSYGTQSQLVFPCLSRHETTRTIVDYFISYAYKENERFLYGLSRQQTGLELQALIESTPTALSSDEMDNIESFYWEKSGDADSELVTLLHFQMSFFSSKNTDLEDNQLCNLNESNKRRLCSLVFDTRVYSEDYVFYDSSFNTQCKCHEKRIKFQNISEKKTRQAYVYVYKCIVNQLKSPFSIEARYLANGFHENSVFVLKRSGRNVVLEAYVPAVSVIAENFSQDTRVKRKNTLKLVRSIPRSIYHSFYSIVDALGK